MREPALEMMRRAKTGLVGNEWVRLVNGVDFVVLGRERSYMFVGGGGGERRCFLG